jgi:signal transduction histidine kinase
MSDARFAESIAKIAHELRSPLTSLQGFSAMLVKRWDQFTDEQRFEFVETIHADSERMARIVSEVLDLARLEAGRLELNRTRCDLAAVVGKARQALRTLPGHERVDVRIPEGLTAWADAARIQHVFSNLLENAIKFSDEGEIVVSAEVSGDAVQIAVADDGVGIEPDRVPDVFSGPGWVSISAGC